MSFVVGAIVRIVKQPHNQSVRLVGDVGWIDEIQDDYVTLQTFDIEGKRLGGGSVPFDCIALEAGEVWKQAKAKVDEEQRKFQLQWDAFQDRCHARLEAVAKKYGVTTETAKAIHRELSGDP